MSTISATTAASQSTVAASSASVNSDAQDRFLKLLVTQLKNQDPLNPMDNAQITSQMAQISTVSGIDQLNATMQSMATSFNSAQSLQATSMIGHNVLAPGNVILLQGSSAVGGVELDAAADAVTVSILDASGQLLHKVDLGAQDAGLLSFQWDGATDSGTNAASGNYRFAIEATSGGKKIGATALAVGQVASVTTGKTGVTLNVNEIGAIALSDVRQVM
ncbi:MAG: flagellar hook assembly protein FlgD [Comamonadaceae bacterium]